MAFEDTVMRSHKTTSNGNSKEVVDITSRRIRRAATRRYAKEMPECRELVGEICSTPMCLMHELVQTMTYADQEQLVRLDKVERDRLIELLGISQKMFEYSLSKLVKAGGIRKIDTGVYSVNPRYFAKGSDFDIDRLIKSFDRITGNPEKDFAEDVK